MGRRAFLASTLAAAVAAVAAVAAAPAAAADDAIVEDGRALAARHGLSASQGVLQARFQEEAGAIAAAARRRWPGSFAGSWIDHDAGGRLTLAFTRDAAGRARAAAAGSGHPELVRGVVLDRPLRELEELQDRMSADRRLADAGFLWFPGADGGGYSLGIDESRNRVTVGVPDPSPATVSAFAGRYGAAVAVHQEGRPVDDDCTRDDCRYLLRGGLKTNLCTIGWTVRRNDTDERMVVSTAHCDGDARWHGGERFGTVVNEQEHGRVDAEKISVWDGSTQFGARPWVFVDVDNKSRDVLSRGDYSQVNQGDSVCKSGVTTGKTCGEVKDKHYSPSSDFSDFVKTNYCAKGGDSGSPVYNGNKAIGIHKGGLDGACSAPGDYSYFGHIEFMQNALNVRVELAG